MALEQYIVRELRQDIKLLISKVTELEQKLERAHPRVTMHQTENRYEHYSCGRQKSIGYEELRQHIDHVTWSSPGRAARPL